MTRSSHQVFVPQLIGVGLAVACITIPAAQPKPRDDGHIPGSLVDLLDQDGWEQPPVEMDTSPEAPEPQAPASESGVAPDQNLNKEQRPGVDQQPPQPDPNDAAALDNLIQQRHAIVDGCNFFQLINDNLEAQQQVAVANAQLVQANVAIGKANTDINIARVQKNEALESRARGNLDAAQRAARNAGQALQQAVAKNQRLWGQLQPNIVKFLALYQQMRKFVVYDRASPRLAAAHGVFKQACGMRADFHEGRVLAALCEAYVGNAGAAVAHLQKGAFFGQPLFFAWQPANDMVLAYLLIGQPVEVAPWIKWVRGVDEKRKTPTRCWLVALHGAIECKDNQAKEWFERCERRINSAAKKANRPPAIPAEVAADWAFFLMTCPNEKFRDLGKAKQLVGNRDPGASWYVARAVAAVAAQEGQWQGAQRSAGLAGAHGPVVLIDEFADQVNAYKNQQPWMRARPVPPAKDPVPARNN